MILQGCVMVDESYVCFVGQEFEYVSVISDG